jgi:hypothetical protein
LKVTWPLLFGQKKKVHLDPGTSTGIKAKHIHEKALGPQTQLLQLHISCLTSWSQAMDRAVKKDHTQDKESKHHVHIEVHPDAFV